MTIWIDAQLPPSLASWLSQRFEIEAFSLKDLSLRDAQDLEIFRAARAETAIIMTKDSDFIDLVCRLGPPPQIIWVTCGNATNRYLRQLLEKTFLDVLGELQKGANFVEVSNVD